MLLVRPLVIGLAVLGFGSLAFAADAPPEPPAKVSYFREIRTIFQDRCQGCHQPAKKGGNFLMTSVADMQKGGDSGEPAFKAGKPFESFLMTQVMALDGKRPTMPKDGEPLHKLQLDLIAKWISEGAVDDTPPSTQAKVDMDHPPIYAGAPVVTSLDYSPDNTLLAVSGYHEVLIHKADGSGLVSRLVGLSERIESAVFSPDGKLLAVTGGSPGRFGEVQIWDVAAKQLKLSVLVTFDTVYGASWSSDGKKVAFGCADNTVRAIDAATGKQVLYQGAHSDWVLDTIFSTDDSHLISVSRDRSTKLTEVATERFVDNITSITPGALKGGLITVDRHPKKDQILIGGADGVPKIYQTYRTQDRKIGDDFNLIRSFGGLPGRIFDAAYNGDGTRIVVGSSNDGTGEVRVYNEADGKLISTFAEQKTAVYAVAYRNDGKQVAVGGFDGTVRLFDPETGKLIKEFVPVPATPGGVATK
jgi:WD40 repeat protein/mono/diheme cytochrome c family protein